MCVDRTSRHVTFHFEHLNVKIHVILDGKGSKGYMITLDPGPNGESRFDWKVGDMLWYLISRLHGPSVPVYLQKKSTDPVSVEASEALRDLCSEFMWK